MLDPKADDYIAKRNAAIVKMVRESKDGVTRDAVADRFGLAKINALTALKTLRARNLIASARAGTIAVWCSTERAAELEKEIREEVKFRRKMRDIDRVRPRWTGSAPKNKIDIDPPMVHSVVSEWDGPAYTKAANSIWAHAARMAA